MNTCFKHHPRHLYTWKSPGDRARNQIDYITINKRFRNCITQVKTYPGGDCGVGCDHIPVVANLRMKLKKVQKKIRVRKDWKCLKRDMALKEAYELEVKNRYERLEQISDEEEGVDRNWNLLQRSLTEAAEDLIPKEPQGRRQVWMTQDILDLMDERRKRKK